MYIYDFFHYAECIHEKASNKKLLLNQKFNRTDNFIDLALFGAQRCVEKQRLSKDTSVYLASRNGNMNTTLKVFDAIFNQNKLPMPFNFLNSVNAAKLFYIAKTFEIEGKTLFVDRFESAIPQAFVDVQKGKTVLLGSVTEVIEDLTLNSALFGSLDPIEESNWLLLSQKLEGRKALAHISDIQFGMQKVESTHFELFEFLEQGCVGDRFTFYGYNLSFNIEKLTLKET